MQTLFEKSRPGRHGIPLDPLDVPQHELPEGLRRAAPPELPELSELDVVRHFTELSRLNIAIDTNFFPLGSCTMKYNPKSNDAIAADPSFAELHPHLSSVPEYRSLCAGALQVIAETARALAEIAGMAAVSLQPLAGAHGELTALLIVAAYHQDRGNRKTKILVPDSAHGTNPASATLAGYQVQTVPSGKDGLLDVGAFREALDDSVAGVMLTCPNTHGLFETEVAEIADLAHGVDALMYYDGANMNAIVGRCRPGDLGFDLMHFNLHKTFSTPHGMGGPGSGPLGAAAHLVEYLPGPRVVAQDEGYDLRWPEHSIGRVAPFFGHFLVFLRAYAYILRQGAQGLREVSTHAVLNANYVRARLAETYQQAFPGLCMHECIFSAAPEAARGVRALDIAKALLDRGFHAHTIYFPLTVRESMMIEPTETEAKETLDAFCDAMIEIAQLAHEQPELLHRLPAGTPVGRLDEARAARVLNCAL